MFKKIKGLIGEKERELPFATLESWVDDEIERVRGEIVDRSRPLIEEIRQGLDEVGREVEDIRNVEKELFRRLNNITKTSQKKFCESILNVIGRVPTGERGYEGVNLFIESSIEALGNIQKMDQMHGKVLYFSFPEEMKAFRASVKNVALVVASLERIINSHKERMSRLVRMRETLTEMRANRETMAEMERQMASMENEAKEERRSSERLTSRLEDLKRSPQYGEAQAASRQERESAEELRKVEDEIHSRLSPLSRIFRKALSAARHGKGGLDENILASYAEKPLDTFLSEEPSYPRLKRLLGGILAMWDSIEEKDKKKLHPMAVSVAEGALVELQERRRSLEAALEQKGEPPGILSEILSIEQECAANVSKRNNIASRVREIQSTLDQLAQKSASLRAALDEQASAISIRILD